MEREPDDAPPRTAAPRRSLLAVLAAGLLPASLPPGALAQGAPPPAAAAEWRFGAIYPLSGGPGLLGDESFRGLEMAVEERNADGGLLGRPIRLLRADAGDEAAAVAEARRLGGTERVAAIFGSYASPVSLAATQAADAGGIPYFELGAAADGITERGFRHLFRTAPRAGDLAAVAVAAVTAVLPPLLGAARTELAVGLLHEEGPFGTSLADGQAARLGEAGVRVAERIAHPSRGPELGGAVQRLREAGTDVILHAAGGNAAAILFRALREAGWRPGMVIGSGGGYGLTETARAIGPGLDGTMVVDGPGPGLPDRAAPGAAAFAEDYKRRYGADPRSGHSLANLVGARIALDALRRAGGADRDRLRAAVLATDIPEGGTAAGWGAAFDERGQNTRARPPLMQWQDGRLVPIHPEAVAAAPPRPRLGPP